MNGGTRDRLRFHRPHVDHWRPFGSDWFGRKAETFARAFGTPVFPFSQTVVVVASVAAQNERLQLLLEANTACMENVEPLVEKLHGRAAGAK